MPNLLFISENNAFKEDLRKQIELYAPEFTFNFDSGINDVIIADEKSDLLPDLQKRYPHAPIFVFIKAGTEKPENKPLIKIISKPFTLNTFLNELKSSINFAAISDAGKLRFNEFELRPLNKEIYNNKRKETVKLTEKEVAVIQYLYKTENRIVSRNELLQEVWGYNPDVSTHTIETHIYRLRQKVEHNDSDTPFIVSEDGGYYLVK